MINRFIYGDRVIVTKGFHKGKTGEVVGRFLFWTEVLFDIQYIISHTLLTSKLRKIEEQETQK